MWTDGQGGALCPLLSPCPAWSVPEAAPSTLPAVTGCHLPYTHFIARRVCYHCLLCLNAMRAGEERSGGAGCSLHQARPNVPPGLSCAPGRPGDRVSVDSGWRNILLSQGDVGVSRQHTSATERLGRPPHGTPWPRGSSWELRPMQALWQRGDRSALRPLPGLGSDPPQLRVPGNAGTPLGLGFLISSGGYGR